MSNSPKTVAEAKATLLEMDARVAKLRIHDEYSSMGIAIRQQRSAEQELLDAIRAEAKTEKKLEFIVSEEDRNSLLDLLSSASSINRDYLRTLDPKRRDNGTENYIERFQSARERLLKAGIR
jgi:hypothetical protein